MSLLTRHCLACRGHATLGRHLTLCAKLAPRESPHPEQRPEAGVVNSIRARISYMTLS